MGFIGLVLIGYARSYYFGPLFNAKPLANYLVHAHAFTMTLGMAGVVLAAPVVLVGMATAIDSHLIRKNSAPGIDPYGFFAIALVTW